MPFYEYRCNDCAHELEAMQKMSDAPLTECPGCNKKTLVKLMSAAGFRLKGSGWYETDFKNSPKKETKKETSDNPSSKTSGSSECAVSSD